MNQQNEILQPNFNNQDYFPVDLVKCNFLLPFRPSATVFPLEKVLTEFFPKKLGRKFTFQFKLFNALSITMYYPEYYVFVGVKWISANIFLVNKAIWSKVLAVKSVNGALFNRQGSFPTHGFEQLKRQEVIITSVLPGSLNEVDNDNVRIFRHKSGLFNVLSTIDDLTSCGYQELPEIEGAPNSPNVTTMTSDVVLNSQVDEIV